MAGEIQLNSTTMATESSGTITLSNVNSATNRTNLGLGSMATQNANSVAITGGTINTVQPATGQSLTIKDEDGNTAITIGTDNTAASYLSLNFGSYHGDSAGAGSGSLTANTLNDYEEGSFTPSFANATGTVYGRYTKIGNLVYVYGEIKSPSITGTVSSISGLPFTNNTGSSGAPTHVAMVRRDYLNYDTAGVGFMNQGGNSISNPQGINGSAYETTNATTPFTWTTNDVLSFSFLYRT